MSGIVVAMVKGSLAHEWQWSRGSEFPMDHKKPVSVPAISFLLCVKCVHFINFMKQNSALDLFPLKRICTYPFSPLSLTHWLNDFAYTPQVGSSKFQQFLVWFCRQIVKKLYAMDRNRNKG